MKKERYAADIPDGSALHMALKAYEERTGHSKATIVRDALLLLARQGTDWRRDYFATVENQQQEPAQ